MKVCFLKKSLESIFWSCGIFGICLQAQRALTLGTIKSLFVFFSFPIPPLLRENSLWRVFLNKQGCIKDTKLYDQFFLLTGKTTGLGGRPAWAKMESTKVF